MLTQQLLAAVQGITETMPISSSAHLTLLTYFYSGTIDQLNRTFIIHLHLFTAIASFAFLYKTCWHMTCGFFSLISSWLRLRKTSTQSIYCTPVLTCFFACLIPAILSFKAQNILKTLLSQNGLLLTTTSLSAIISGLLLYTADNTKKKNLEIEDLKLKHCLPLAALQTIAFLPGFSRLGAALTTLRFLGFSKSASWKLSIFLGIPLSFGASALTYLQNQTSFSFEPNIMIITTLCTFIFYFVSTRIPLKLFACYKVIFGIALYIYS